MTSMGTADAERALDELSKHIDEEPLTVGDPGRTLSIKLRRLREHASQPGRRAVLLIHGGNTSSETFLVPRGGLASYLSEKGWDVWLVENRASPRVLDAEILRGAPLGGSIKAERKYFTFDRIAEDDVVGAVAAIREKIGFDTPLSIVGHCVGGATTSMAVARGLLSKFRIHAYVLTTMGLFFESPWDGWVKAEDFVIERALSDDPECRGIDPLQIRPRVIEPPRPPPRPWPRDLEDVFEAWPGAWLPRRSRVPEEDMLRRLAFMFGAPYTPDRLDPGLRGRILCRLFGTMHLGLYLHAGQVVRRGFAARFDEPDVVERHRLATPPRAHHARRRARRGPRPERAPQGDLDSTHFRDQRILLVTGAQNRLWHRDSVDLMYEWLRNIAHTPGVARVEKRVFSEYAHQDLYWRRDPGDPVYEAIASGLS